MTEEERQEAERDWQEFRANMNADRLAEGRLPVYV